MTQRIVESQKWFRFFYCWSSEIELLSVSRKICSAVDDDILQAHSLPIILVLTSYQFQATKKRLEIKLTHNANVFPYKKTLLKKAVNNDDSSMTQFSCCFCNWHLTVLMLLIDKP